MQITINNATITGEDGTVTKATIAGDATLTPGEPGVPTHPINLPPTSDNPDVIFILTFCPNPPPPHWEWIGFLPGSPPERPHPAPEPPPEGEIPTTPGGVKPPPPGGGWGYWPEYGWVYYPGPIGAGPKKRK